MLGIITIALGEKKYVDMSKMLALSLIQTNPNIKRAVISDAPENEFKGYYDLFIPANETFGKGIKQKLYLDQYTPFEETFFIDADCLVCDSLEQTILLCRKYSFVVFGSQISSGEWYMDVSAMCKRFNLPSIPLFNGGMYYFNNKDVAAKIYIRARELSEHYDELGFRRLRGSVNEEPLISVALATNNIEAVDDKGKSMRTPIGIEGPFNIDILNRRCSFIKSAELAEPAIIHFAGSFANAFHYKREVRKLKIACTLPFLNSQLISSMINLVYNVPYALLIFIKRLLKTIIRKEKFDYRNTLPAFSNQ